MKKRNRIVETEELRRLGVPEAFFEPAQYYAENDAFAEEPSPELLERTIAICLEELDKKPHIATPDLADAIPALQVAYAQARDSYSEIMKLGPLPAVYAKSVWYALGNPGPPLVIVENHNQISPSWWRGRELKPVRIACGKVNELARALSRPVSSRVVVLKHDFKNYSTEDLEEMASLHRQGTSDIYWITTEYAGQFATVDETVVGDLCVLKMAGKPESPTHAVESLLSSTDEDSFQAKIERIRIQKMMNKAVPIKVGGHFTPEFRALFSDTEGTRHAIEMVISHCQKREESDDLHLTARG